MIGEDLFWVLHGLFVIGMILFSWSRSRHILHPHFILTGIFSVFLSDFLARGYDINNDPDAYRQSLDHIFPGDLYLYQAMIMASIAIILVVSAMIRIPHLERRLANVHLGLRPSRSLQSFVLAFIVAIVAMELVKRLASVGWSPGAVIEQSLGVRGRRDWDQAQYQGNAIFALISIMQPLGASAAAYLMICGSGTKRAFAFFVLLIGIAILVTDGSRTTAVIVFASAWFILVLRYKGVMARVAFTAGIVLTLAVVTSAMISFRGTGFVASSQNHKDFQFVYHQDDNYYRALNAFDYAGRSNFRWDAWEFFSAIIFNPIPRAIWPGKPLLTPDFWGGFKLWWVTISAFGESAALFGLAGGFVFATAFGIFMYWILCQGLRLLNKPIGVIAYILVALYVYMILRSFLSLTHYIYLPLLAIAMVWVLTLFSPRREPVMMQYRRRYRG